MSEFVAVTQVDVHSAKAGIQPRAVNHRRTRTRLYLGMAGTLLVIVLAGFAKTFYLRAFFDVPAIPVYLFAHGFVLTAWFAGLLLQTAFVAVRRTDIHRRLGWVVCGIGLAVVGISLMVTLNFVPRQRDLGVDIESGLAGLSSVVWTDLAALLVFSVFLLAAVALRRRSEFHRRLMLLASISIVSPAMTRMWHFPIFDGLSGTFLSLGALSLLLLALGLYDLISTKRIHPVTLAGASFFMALRLLSTLVVARSEFGQNFVRGLG